MKRATWMVVALALVLPVAARADHDEQAAAGGEKADFLAVYDDAAKKLTDLAKAIPEDKYGWRPADGVRSVSEVVEHVAGGVYYLTLSMGLKPPAGHPQSFEEAGALEKTTAKDAAIADMEKALTFGREAAAQANPEMLEKEVEFFGQKKSVREMFLIFQGHNQEHLGQLIAYARMNGVVPPWSQGESSGG